jgi:hypothetical protein
LRWRKRWRKEWSSRQRYIIGLFGLDSRHHRGCESFRIDSHTIKRRTLSI